MLATQALCYDRGRVVEDLVGRLEQHLVVHVQRALHQVRAVLRCLATLRDLAASRANCRRLPANAQCRSHELNN